MKRSMTNVAIAGAALALVATPAQAARVSQYNYPEECFSYYDEYLGDTTVCYSARGHYNYTVTPSGNESYVGKDTSTFSVSNSSYSYSSSFDSRFHVLIKRGETHVVHQKYSDSYTVDGQTCTFTANFTYANGEVRHDEATNSCS
jgi:hypothetical protein